MTANETPEIHNRRISSQTVINRVRKRGIRFCRPLIGVVYNARRRQNRVNWGRTQNLGAWRQRNWRRVIFSDEFRYQLYRADGRDRVYRCVEERYAMPCVRKINRFWGGSVMVWGAIRFA